MSARFKSILRLAGFYFVLFVLLRMTFYFIFKSSAAHYRVDELVKALFIGLRFDIRLALGFVLPYALLVWTPFLNPRRNGARIVWLVYSVFMLAASGVVYAFDFGYYSYLNSRINATVLKFAENPLISMQMVWETYPVMRAVLAWVVFLSVAGYFINRFILTVPPKEASTKTAVAEKKSQKRLLKVAKIALVVFFYFAGLWGALSQYPLRWSEAFFSGNTFVSAMALNPALYFVDTFKNRQANYDRALAQKYYPQISKYLDVDNPSLENLNYLRVVGPTAKASKQPPPNIVYIVMESFAAYRTGAFGGQFNATPQFDEWVNKGTLFTNFYVPSEATARSMFCAFVGLPDVGAGQSSSRNPLVVNQNSIVNAFTQHEKYFLIGGSASWGNIRGVIANNVKDINILEEGQHKSERTDVWGISDLDLFREANERFSKESKPFFAVVQTAGFHRPYTIPKDHGSFELKNLTDKELADGGYVSLAEYNSLRFSDYALGEYLKMASKEPYFKNTIFVIHGDHGLPGGAATSLSPGVQAFGLTRWHVPLLLIGPGLQPQKVDKIASQVDVLPTLASLLGVRYHNTSLGRDLFDTKFDDNRMAFLYVWYQNPPQIGVITDRYYTYGTPGAVSGLYDYRSANPLTNISAENPEKTKELIEMAEGLHESTKYMLYHNPPLDHTRRP